MGKLRTTALLTTLVAGAHGLLAASPATAEYNIGVKSVHIVGIDDSCEPGTPLPCTPGAGTGDANVITVRQTALGNGEYAFDHVETTSIDDSHVWLAAEVGAECRRGYSLFRATAFPGVSLSPDGLWSDVSEVDGFEGIDIPVPDARTMPNKVVALHVPIGELFAMGAIEYYETPHAVYERGENEIAQRMAAGMSEAQARALPFESNTWATINVDVVCRGNVGLHVKYSKAPAAQIPLTFRFEGIQMGVRETHDGPGVLTPGPAVTSANLIVTPDEEACSITVTGTLTADLDVDVTYRLLDSYGQGSQLFHTTIPGGQSRVVLHELAVPQSEALDGPAFAPAQGPADLDDYADAPTDLVQGTYQLEILSPNHLLSNVDGFSMEACTPPTPTTFEVGNDGLTLGQRARL